MRVQAQAVGEGEAYNGLSAEVELVSSLNFVKAVTAIGTSAGGSKAEDENKYLNRLVNYLQLSAPRPVTALDYANFALTADIPNAAGTGDVLVARAVALDGGPPGEATFEGTIESGHLETIKEVTSFTGVTVGSELKDIAGGLTPERPSRRSTQLRKLHAQHGCLRYSRQRENYVDRQLPKRAVGNAVRTGPKAKKSTQMIVKLSKVIS